MDLDFAPVECSIICDLVCDCGAEFQDADVDAVYDGSWELAEDVMCPVCEGTLVFDGIHGIEAW